MTILITILVILAVPLVGALCLSTSYVIEREVVINKSKEEVFNYIKLLRNHNHFNKWSLTDPAMRSEFTGTDGTVGFISAWNSDNKNVGKGEQEITSIGDGRIETELRFKKPFEGKANSYMSAESLSNTQTRLKWVFSGIRDYPNRIMHFMLNLKKMLGKDLQAGLNNLKTVMEK